MANSVEEYNMLVQEMIRKDRDITVEGAEHMVTMVVAMGVTVARSHNSTTMGCMFVADTVAHFMSALHEAGINSAPVLQAIRNITCEEEG